MAKAAHQRQPAVRKLAPARNAPPSGAQQVSILESGKIYRAGTLERIKMIKAGVQAQATKALINHLILDQKRVVSALNLKTATLNRKAAQGGILPTDESERVLGLSSLIGQVQDMVEKSGNPAGFNAAEWLSRWLQEPLPALNGVKPIDLLDTMEGQALVSRNLAQIQSGAYA